MDCKHLTDKIKSMSLPEIISWLVDEAIRNKKEDASSYLELKNEINRIHGEIHSCFTTKKLEEIEKKIYDLWNLLPSGNEVLTKKQLEQILKMYYTKSESNARFGVEPIDIMEVFEVGKEVFEGRGRI